MDAKERGKLIEEYGRGHGLLMEALEQIPPAAWDFRPAPTEWSVKEVLGHLTDAEIAAATRLNMIVTAPGSTLMPYDDVAWARALNHPGRNMQEALELFRLVRRTNYDLLVALPESAFTNRVIHPENGYPEYGPDYTVEKWLRIYTRHVRDHSEQLTAIHSAWKGGGRA